MSLVFKKMDEIWMAGSKQFLLKYNKETLEDNFIPTLYSTINSHCLLKSLLNKDLFISTLIWYWKQRHYKIDAFFWS